MSFKLNYSESTLNKNFYKFGNKLGVTVLMYAATKAIDIQSDMQRNRPWTDRTGMAKATLNTKVSQPNETTVRITLAHGVDYGIWLELANEQNYAIIIPTIEKEKNVIIGDMQNLFNQIK